MASSTIKRTKQGSEQQLIPTGGIGMEGSTKIQRSRNLHFRAFRGPGDHPPSTTTVTGFSIFSMTFSFTTGQMVMANDDTRESRRPVDAHVHKYTSTNIHMSDVLKMRKQENATSIEKEST